MGTRIVETDAHGNTVRELAHTTGVAWTDAADMAISNGRKRELAETLIARAKRNAKVIADQERAQQGRRHEQSRTLQALADSLPFGTRVEFDDQGTPVGLVNLEDTPEQEDDGDAWRRFDGPSRELDDSPGDDPSEKSSESTQAPNKFDAIALQAASA